MSITETIESIIQKRETLTDETKVRYGAINPILSELGWDIYDVEEVEPEHRVNNKKKVDYALRPHGGQLEVFVEAKKIGGVTESGEEQLFNYATNQGVPLLVLTDGFIWQFYLSMAEGKPRERLFLELEINNETPSRFEILEKLNRLLNKDSVLSDESKRYAQSLLDAKRLPLKLKNYISKIWSNTVSGDDSDNLIVEYFCEELKDKFKIEANPKEVITELRHYRRSDDGSSATIDSSFVIKRQKSKGSNRKKGSKIISFTYSGSKFPAANNTNCLVQIVNMFGEKDIGFMEALEEATTGTKRRLVSRDKSKLFVRPDLVRKHAKKLDNGWYIGLNVGYDRIISHISKICQIKGIEFGKDLSVQTK